MLHPSSLTNHSDSTEPPIIHLEPMHSDWFSKDGKGTIFLEGIPGVGYVVAAAQVMEGNPVSYRYSAISPIGMLTPSSH